MDPRVISTAARAGNVIESTLAALRPGRREPATKRLRIVTHRGLGDPSMLTVRGRVVLEAPTIRRTLRRGGEVTAREHLVAVYRAFDADEIAGAVLAIECAGVRTEARSDRSGCFVAHLPAPAGSAWSGGVHGARVQLVSLPGATEEALASCLAQTADVYVAGADASLMVISDLDDTAMDTNTVDSVRMLRTVLLRSARRRQPIPGIPELYRALRDGSAPSGRSANNPVCYISSGAWNLYDVVVDYLDAHGMPVGAIMLNDWGSRARGYHPVSHAHKGAHVRSLLERLPTLPLLLVGDDVQEDPELYGAVARAHPGRIRAIWIRSVRGDRERTAAIARLGASLTDVGTGFVVSASTATFVADARRRGWIAD